jgi:two-component system, cell cycle sensor histidine kinase and response regulator CckA
MAGNGGQPTTVLVADDNDGVRELVVMILGRRGWTTLEAADGHEAVHLIDRAFQTIDLLVTDIVMPRVGGLEVLARARARRPDLPVLVMSVTNRQELPHGSIGSDVIFLQKPFTVQELIEATEMALSAAPDVAMAQTSIPEVSPATAGSSRPASTGRRG